MFHFHHHLLLLAVAAISTSYTVHSSAVCEMHVLELRKCEGSFVIITLNIRAAREMICRCVVSHLNETAPGWLFLLIHSLVKKNKGNNYGEITLNVVVQLLLCGSSINMQENMIENVVVAFFNDLHVDGWSRTVTDGRRSRLETVYT